MSSYLLFSLLGETLYFVCYSLYFVHVRHVVGEKERVESCEWEGRKGVVVKSRNS